MTKYYGTPLPWAPVVEAKSRAVTAGESIDVRSIAAVAFDRDMSVTIGALPVAWSLRAFDALPIDEATETITVDADGYLFALGV
jgi:hypothetical protein